MNPKLSAVSSSESLAKSNQLGALDLGASVLPLSGGPLAFPLPASVSLGHRLTPTQTANPKSKTLKPKPVALNP